MGQTMGTSYSITAYNISFLDYISLTQSIRKRLRTINQSMSTYIPTSEISTFNALLLNEELVISSDFYTVLEESKRIYFLTEGAWDPTIKPLIDRWGFSEKKTLFIWPSDAEILVLKQSLGFDYVELIPPNKIKKNRPGLFLDLSSIAKGYAVDEIIELLQLYLVEAAMVEIGGEVRVFGEKPDTEPWKIGLNIPDPISSRHDFYKIISLDNQALATSGDYRNFKEYQGQRYSHIIDPRTGFPVTGIVHSVSIVAPNCMLADALATACLVLGKDKSISLLNSFENVKMVSFDD